MKLMSAAEIKNALNIERALALQEEGFTLYSKGKITVPPVGYMNFGQETVDSKSQCIDHGETYHPYESGIIQAKDLVELGEVIGNPQLQRQSEEQITLADLTGVSVQDIQIAKSVLFPEK